VSLLASDVANRAATFVLYALVARYVGASDFGRMSLALTFFYVFQTFAVAGLKTLIIREVAKDRTKTAQYLVNGSAVVVVTSLVSISILLLFVRLVQYSAETTSVILLLSLALLPYSMASICEAVFQAWEAMHYFAYTNVSVNVAKVGLAFLMLSQGYGLYHLVILLLVCHVASAALEWRLVLRHITRPRSGIDLHFSLAMSRATSTFLGIDSLIAIVGSLNVVLLSKLVGETEVGLYSAAVQLLAPMHLIFMSIVLSVFPMMCRRFEPSFHGLKQISEHLIALLMSIALPMTVGMFFLANSVLLFLYGDKEFLLASGALRIVIWNLVLVALTSVFGQVLIASLREKVALRIVATDALVTLGLGLLLIRPFGVIGAAVTALLTGLADFLQHFVPVSRLFASISWGRLLWKPVVATVCMAVFLIAVHPDEGLLTVVVAGTVYTGVLCALTIWSVGGPRQLKSKYLYLWSENGTPGVMWSPADE
jgi:O-antigen/teichoic acid export membrane protein